MEDNKKLEIKAVVVTEFDNYPTKIDLGREIESGFIFGKYANNEHYSITELLDIILEVEQEKNPPIVIEEVITPETIRLDLEEQIASEPIVESEIPFIDDGN
jgi:hypothetical protein